MSKPYSRPVKFAVGTVTMTPFAFEALAAVDFELIHLLKRHREGDYGEMPYEDRQRNERSIEQSGLVFSRYPLPSGVVICIDTAADRESTDVYVLGGVG